MSSSNEHTLLLRLQSVGRTLAHRILLLWASEVKNGGEGKITSRVEVRDRSETDFALET